MEEIETVPTGGKGTKRQGYPTEIPPKALLEVSKVMKHGADKYGSKNWHGNTVYVELDHCLTHLYQYLDNGGVDELSHAAARCLMALDHVLRRQQAGSEFFEEIVVMPTVRPSCVPALGGKV